MIRRLYIHNFRCLENFDLRIGGQSSILLIGKNGSGKSTVGFALEILQRIARGTNRVGDLVKPKDLARGRADVPMRFEIQVEIGAQVYEYAIAFEFPASFKELRVLEEKLLIEGNPVYTRNTTEVILTRQTADKETKFFIDWHLVALSIIQEQSSKGPLSVFRRWLSRALILRPIPSLINGNVEPEQGTLEPNLEVTNCAAWFFGLVSERPAVYVKIDAYLKQVMPDFMDLINAEVRKSYRRIVAQFANEQGTVAVNFEDLSDGEKCFVICALVLAANEPDDPVLCFWDEPDNFLALSEVGHFVLALRKAFKSGGQFIATSHNEEAIRRFSNENTLYLHRKSHLEPTIIRPVSDLQVNGDLVSALIRDDVQP